MKQTLTLLKPHTHLGQRLQPGDEIEASYAIAKWLTNLGIAKAKPAVTGSTKTIRKNQPQKKEA